MDHSEELCTWCKKSATGQGDGQRVCTGCNRIVAICECHRALGVQEGWRVSARRVWGYDSDGNSRKWGFGNAVELTALRDDEDRDAGITHVRQFVIRTSALTEIVDTLKLVEGIA